MRDYEKEYAKYHSKPDQKKRRAGRNKARALMIKKGRASKGDGKDVDHKNGNAKDNSKKNLRVSTKKANRSFPRNSKAGRK